MTAATSQLIGRFGNQLFQYAHARAYSEQHGIPLRLPRWLGEDVFQLSSERPRGNEQPLGGYRQRQSDLIYTRSQVRSWFQWRPEIAALLSALPPDPLLAHRRVGDYFGYGYVVVSEASYRLACSRHNLDERQLVFITEENPTSVPGLPNHLAFLPDFYRLTRAACLLRANSSFSWWAATLADPAQRVFAPVIDNLPGGVEHHVEFVPGNHPKFANLPDCENLELLP